MTGNVTAVGSVFAFAAAIAFAAYIVVGKRVSQHAQGLDGLAVALDHRGRLADPAGIAFARPGLAEASVLATLALAGVMATFIPFSLEAIALRTLPMATFGLLLAFEPAVAALAGVVIRGDSLSIVEVLGIGLDHRRRGRKFRSARVDAPRSVAYNRRVMADPKVQALARVPLFSGLSPRDLPRLRLGRGAGGRARFDPDPGRRARATSSS